MYFKFERREPKQPEYRTMADVPDDVRCVVANTGCISRQMVRVRRGGVLRTTDGVAFDEEPHSANVIQVLDPLPNPPLPKTLADVEELRCVMLVDCYVMFFRHDFRLYSYDVLDGELRRIKDVEDLRIVSLTDIYAVVCEVGP